MSNYALVKNGIVENIILADAEFINSLPDKNDYIEYVNAGIGWTYDAAKNRFIAPKPYNATGFDEDTGQWIVPLNNEA